MNMRNIRKSARTKARAGAGAKGKGKAGARAMAGLSAAKAKARTGAGAGAGALPPKLRGGHRTATLPKAAALLFFVFGSLSAALAGSGQAPPLPPGRGAQSSAAGAPAPVAETDLAGQPSPTAKATAAPAPRPTATPPAPSPSPAAPRPTATPQPTATPTPAPLTTGDLPDDGRAYAAANGFVFPIAGRRPFAVMIDNQGGRVLPQGGLDRAQIVYEIIVEGGITRFMPLFWIQGEPSAEATAAAAPAPATSPATSPDAAAPATESGAIWGAISPAAAPDGDPVPIVGPVRSARHYFLNYVLEHDAIYFHIGQSYIALREFKPLKIDHVDSVGVYHDLTRDRNNWQDSFTSSEKMLAHVEKNGYRAETSQPGVFEYYLSDRPLEAGEPCAQLRIGYSASYFDDYAYDAESGLYARSRNGKPHMARESESSAETSTRISAKNVVIQFIRNSTYDSEDRQELHDVGSGEGWFATLGKIAKLRWSKESRGAQTVFAYESGEPLTLNPGQTFVQIVPIGGEVSFS